MAMHHVGNPIHLLTKIYRRTTQKSEALPVVILITRGADVDCRPTEILIMLNKVTRQF